MKGTVYKIFNDINNVIYIGSTTVPIQKRLLAHRNNKKTTLHKYISNVNNSNTDAIDWDDLKIESIETNEFESYKDLYKLEGGYIKKFKADSNFITLNRMVAGRTDKEYYNDNLEKYKNKYLIKCNKDIVKSYKKTDKKTDGKYLSNKKYRENNREKVREYQRNYRISRLGQLS